MADFATIRLKFDDVELENRWQRDNFKQSRTQVRIATLIALLIASTYGAVDRIILPPELGDTTLWPQRLVLAATFAVILILSLFDWFERIWQQCLVIGTLTAVGGLTWMWLILEASNGLFHASIYWFYHNGLVLIIIYTFLFLRLTFRSALIVAWVTMAIFVLVASVRPEPEINLVAAISMFFVVVIALYAVHGLESSERKVYRQRFLIDQQRKELARSFEELQAEKQKTEEYAQRLVELDAVKNRFIQNISHEFRTPLTLIVGPLQDAVEGFFDRDPVELRRQLGVMLRSSRNLLQLVNRMLDLSKLESGKLELSTEPADLVSIVRTTARSFMPLAERRAIKFGFESDCETLPCLCDKDKVEKVVLNLVSNALNFTPREGEVLVGLSAQPHPDVVNARITVKDTGPGIAPEDVDRIFDRFYQAEMSTTRRFEGTGIGLSLTKELVELHGGSIRVDSTLGSGTCFEVSMPLERVPEELVVTDPESGPEDFQPIDLPATYSVARESAATAGATILVVDDNQEVREYIGSHLHEDYRLLEAENGEEGLEVAKTHLPDLILCDVVMPGMDGHEMVRRIRQVESLQNVPVIMLTAKADESDVVEGIKSGADEYLVKPFRSNELRERVAGVISRRRQLREQFSQEVVVKGMDVVVKSDDAVFLETLSSIVDARLHDPGFGVDWLADEIGFSRRQLERKLREILGETPAMFIRRYRLERASQLLRAGSGTVAEIAYAVGFNSADYFARVFRNAYGESPSEHARREA